MPITTKLYVEVLQDFYRQIDGSKTSNLLQLRIVLLLHEVDYLLHLQKLNQLFLFRKKDFPGLKELSIFENVIFGLIVVQISLQASLKRLPRCWLILPAIFLLHVDVHHETTYQDVKLISRYVLDIQVVFGFLHCVFLGCDGMYFCTLTFVN